jgi:APA family basic amino acid/polyamine antiporter
MHAGARYATAVNPEANPDPASKAKDVPATSAGEPPSALARQLGLFDITMLVMGSVIGAGIFVVPHDVAALLPVPGLILAAWVVGGLVSMAGCLVYAELTRRRPHVGGQYAFLREAYHPAIAFAYGWSLLAIIHSGGMAAVAVVFGRYFNELTHLFGTESNPQSFLGLPADAVTAAVAIAAVTAINCTGARTGSTTQNIFMVLKILAIVALIGCGLLMADGTPSLDASAGKGLADDWTLMTAFAAALVPVFFAYGGWHTTTFMAAEVRDPTRTLPRGLVLGVAGVIALYVGISFVCLRVLGVQELARNESPAYAVMRRALGAPGAVAVSAGIAISALGFVSQASLTSPRVYYAMARDGLFFRAVTWVQPRTGSPVVAVLLQGTFALILALSRTFREILNSVMSVEMTFWALTAVSLFLIRRRDRAARVASGRAIPGHPVTTVLFAAVNVILVLALLYTDTWNTLAMMGLALVALPVYFLWRWRLRRNSKALR